MAVAHSYFACHLNFTWQAIVFTTVSALDKHLVSCVYFMPHENLKLMPARSTSSDSASLILFVSNAIFSAGLCGLNYCRVGVFSNVCSIMLSLIGQLDYTFIWHISIWINL